LSLIERNTAMLTAGISRLTSVAQRRPALRSAASAYAAITIAGRLKRMSSQGRVESRKKHATDRRRLGCSSIRSAISAAAASAAPAARSGCTAVE
jgi:hypothetical protein